MNTRWSKIKKRATKSQYSTFSHTLLKNFKKFGEGTENSMIDFIDRVYGVDINQVSKGFGDEDTYAVDVMAAFLWKFRKIDHYFLADGVADFCVSSVKEFSKDFCKPLPACDPVDTANSKFFMAKFAVNNDGLFNGAFAVHFPTKERIRSVIVIPNAHIVFNLPTNRRYHNGHILGRRFYFVCTDGEDVLLMPIEEKRPFADEGQNYLAKLVFGLSLYMDAFPEAVIMAKDGNILHLDGYSKRNPSRKMAVKRNQILEEEESRKTSPHWRRGHFRILNSERFIHKNGQTVYVRGSFVKGRAFDVMNDAPSLATLA